VGKKHTNRTIQRSLRKSPRRAKKRAFSSAGLLSRALPATLPSRTFDKLAYGEITNLPNTRTMSKEDCIEVTGTVVEKFPSGLFSVQLDQERTVLAHLAGKLRRNRIRVLAGDRVTLELSPYDLTKGRITYRHK
jgi:translation initiation factor IF-1